MSGWFAVKRGTIEHELFAPVGKWSRYEAWTWLIENAVFADTTIDIAGKPFRLKRGQMAFSQRFLAGKWKWSQKAVQTFLKTLQSHNAVEISEAKTGKGTASRRTLITLCNYNKYQSPGIKEESREHQESIKEEQLTNTPPSEGASAADPVKVMFDSGKDLLMKAGKSRDQAGKLLGMWRKAHGPEAVISALGRAQREGAIDPVSFIEGCFRFQQKSRPKWQEGAFRALSPHRVQEFMHGRWEHRGDLTEAEISGHPKFIGRAPAYREEANAV